MSGSSTLARRGAPLLDRTDAALMAALTIAGMGLRLWWFSGYGLGDDVIIRHATAWFLESGNPPGANYGYRFAWWGPTVLAAAVLGVRESAVLLPILLAATLSFPLVYALGAAIWGRAGGVVATLLLTAMPLDFAWSTMVTPDIVCSTFILACMLCLVRAAAPQTPAARRWLLVVAALTAWLAFHVKVSAGLMVVPILATFWMHRAVLGRDSAAFFAVATLLFGLTTIASVALTGDPIFAYSSELAAQGLRVPEAVTWHRVTWPVFMHFPWAVFSTNQYGNVLFGGYPHLLLGGTLVLLLLGLRTGGAEVWWWLVALAIGLQFNFQRMDDVWIAGFRNVRHLHGLAHPLVLLLAGCLVQLRTRSRPAFALILAGTLGFGLWHATATAMLTKVSFADRRAACRVLVDLPPKMIHTDFQIDTGCAIAPGGPNLKFTPVLGVPGPERGAALAALGDVYVVTGGGREPHYGCVDCMPLARELDPAGWRLVFEAPGPSAPTVWRPEPLRIWERRA